MTIEIVNDYRQQLNNMKLEMEQSTDVEECPSMRGHRIPLRRLRKLFESARDKYIAQGGKYVMSEEEQNDQDFQNNIDAISRIEYSSNGCVCCGDKQYIKFTEDNRCVTGYSFGENDDGGLPMFEPTEKIRQKIINLHIGEWIGKDYDAINVLDGEQWEVYITFSNGHVPIEIAGSNAYPYNFEDFLKLF